MKIKLHQCPDFLHRQPVASHLDQCPSRMILCAPSGSGKTVVLVDMILRLYRKCFDRIVIFSPSISLDHTWQPVRRYCSSFEDLSKNFFDTWNTDTLAQILSDHSKIVDLCKKKHKSQPIPQLLVVVDDFADDQRVSGSRHGGLSGGSWLVSLFCRGRHSGVTTWLSTQKYRLLSNVIRVNATSLLVWRQRNNAEKQAILEELSALLPEETLEAFYEHATAKKHDFMYVNLMAPSVSDMFYHNFENRLCVEEDKECQESAPASEKSASPSKSSVPSDLTTNK